MRVVVASADEVPPGARKIVDVEGRSIGVFNVDGEFFALRNRCPHQGGALCAGRLWGVLESEAPGVFDYEPRREILTCPWHGWEFHVRTGQSWCAPGELAVRAYDVEVVPGADLGAAGEVDEPAACLNNPDPDETPVPGRVKGPYVAETYPVSLEGDYLVVELPAASGPARPPG